MPIMKNTFEEIKNSVNILDVAAQLDVTVSRHGKALCFIHGEKTPSLSFKGNRWHCFGCGAGGDVLDMVAAIQGVSMLDAAKQLDAMYSLHLFDKQSDAAEVRRRAQRAQTERNRLKAFEDWERQACNTVALYLRTLEAWKCDLAPKTPEEPWATQFCESLSNLDLWEYLYTEVFINGDFQTRVDFYKKYAKEVEVLAKWLNGNRKSKTA